MSSEIPANVEFQYIMLTHQVDFAQSFFSSYGILEVMANATPIIIAGSGMIIAFRCGLWNLGAEGQMAIGAIVSTAIGVNLNLPGIILIPIIFAVANTINTVPILSHA